MSERKATVSRDTLETRITVAVNLDGTGVANQETGLPFLEHMLDQVARHGLVDLEIRAQGDLHIDAHHTVEDIGITLGQAFAQALGDKGSGRGGFGRQDPADRGNFGDTDLGFSYGDCVAVCAYRLLWAFERFAYVECFMGRSNSFTGSTFTPL